MSTTKASYGSPTSITITAATLANGAARECLRVDNSGVGARYLDALLQLAVTLAAGSPAGDKVVNIYAYGSTDGSNYTDNATGADAAITLRTPTNLVLVATLYCPDAGALTYKGVVSLAAAFNGVLPPYWGIVIENKTGLAFTACTASYIGLAAAHQ